MSQDPSPIAPQLQSGDITWLDGDVPLSQAFDDPFYSKRDGRAEVEHVFLAGNGLPARWVGVEKFCIAELGFGTGLNFVETWRHWCTLRQSGQTLTYVSFEKFAMTAQQMQRALAPWPELQKQATRLVDVWAARKQDPGPWEMDEQTHLLVIPGDAQDTIKRFDAKADAWFLDGFSPAKNAEMWSAELMKEVAKHTKQDGTFATYTAAGWVRRNLVDAGFEVTKRPGHAGKRDMSVGTLKSGSKTA
ncbi:MAG: tRNA (5-methylaminomethyl-2-thiouridine)(34)-methyltransferase MnmD [Pseudomonadota bacterium]